MRRAQEILYPLAGSDAAAGNGNDSMSTIFQGQCGHCDYKTGMMPAWYGAVLVDRPADAGHPEAGMASVDDPRFVGRKEVVEVSVDVRGDVIVRVNDKCHDGQALYFIWGSRI